MQRPLSVWDLRAYVRSGVLAAVVTGLTLLSSCTEIARPGPGEVAITKGAGDIAGFTLIDVNADTIQHYMLSRRGDSAGTLSTSYSPRIRLSPGDVISVSIAESKEGGLFAPLATGGTSFAAIRIDHKGTVSLPYAGRVPVAGLDTQGVEDRIKSRLGGVTFEPQVFVQLVSDRSSTVLVSGEVKAPTRVSLLEGPMTIIDAISRAGGPALPPHQTDVVLRRGKTVKRIPLASIQGGRNIQLQRGDEIVLEADLKVFNALGAVGKTGQFEFEKPDPSLLDGLALVGGLSNTNAHNTGVFVFRLDEPRAWQDENGTWQSGPVIFKFDMARPETFFFEQVFALKANDTIYVTNAPAVELLRVLSPIAQTIGTVRTGFTFGTTIVEP